MINFDRYYILCEGGNVFKNHPTTRIYLQDIKPTVDFLSGILGINLSKNLLGSTGKKESSGDIDIAIDETKYTKDQIANILKDWCEERKLDPKDYIAKSGISVHFRTPIIGQNEQFVQTDFMLVSDVKFAQFGFANDETEPYKGKHRTILLSNLAKNINLTYSNAKGLTDRATKAVVENKDPDRVAQILLGDTRARARNIKTIPIILNFLMKKYNDISIVANIVAESRNTILQQDNLDIIDIITPQQLTESTTAEGQRVGVQHLYSEYKSDQYSMNFENFTEFLKILQDNNGIIQPGNSSVSEKADGMSVKFGLTSELKFFLQGSYSGPVTDGNFAGKIKHEPTRIAFEKNFSKIKSLVYKPLMRYAKDLGLNGIRVQAEWLYSPFALTRQDNPNIVYFVATNYERDKLGVWSTFPIINITDYAGQDVGEDRKYDIIKSLVDLSTKDVKFLPLDIEMFNPIDLSAEMHGALQELNTFKSQNPNYEEVLYNPSRTRDDQQAKKAMRAHLVRSFLPFQKKMHHKILKELNRLAGKLGDYEGLVIKLKSKNSEPFFFKVISPTFHKNKGRI